MWLLASAMTASYPVVENVGADKDSQASDDPAVALIDERSI
jgi:hypothetical protein